MENSVKICGFSEQFKWFCVGERPICAKKNVVSKISKFVLMRS